MSGFADTVAKKRAALQEAARPQVGGLVHSEFWHLVWIRLISAAVALCVIPACQDIAQDKSPTPATPQNARAAAARDMLTLATVPGSPLEGRLVVEKLSSSQALQVRAAMLPPLPAQVEAAITPTPLPRETVTVPPETVTKVAYSPVAPRNSASPPGPGSPAETPVKRQGLHDQTTGSAQASAQASPPLSPAAAPAPRTVQAPVSTVVSTSGSPPKVASIPPVERPTPAPTTTFRCTLPLADAESVRLLRISTESAEYSEARRCVLRQLKQSGNHSEIKRLVKEQQAQQPLSRYDPLLLLELAEAELMTGGLDAALKASEDARRYLSRAQSASPWVLEARIEEIQGRTFRKQYEQKADAVLLDKAVQRWQDYRSLVAQQDPRRVGLADKELERLELLRKRHP